MGFVFTSRDYMGYIKAAADKIAANGDYITGLDAATGDGDHWVNINKGFVSMLEAAADLEGLAIDALFKKLGSIFMSKVGGSSGILYGGAYMAAGNAVSGKEALGAAELCMALEAMVSDMMKRGKAEPGMKTMIDSLYPAVEAFKKGLSTGAGEGEIMAQVKQAALDGAENTRAMEAVKGRASYQTGKGVGALDPGAVTMSYQIECLCDYITQNLM